MTASALRARRARPARLLAVVVLVVVAAIVADLYLALRHDDKRRAYIASTTGWPTVGQAAYRLGDGPSLASPNARAVPIASVAKVMTAYLVLEDGQPLDSRAYLTVTPTDFADSVRRAQSDESIVRVAVGERLTKRQALEALLLPSANNIAIMLARRVAGSVSAFVTAMNRAAQRLGMRHTRYTDPSGLAASTVSTAADQLKLAVVAMHDDTFAELVGTSEARLPVAGLVHNTDTLLGKDGFVGIKTGSDDAAGGCFMFQSWRNVDGSVEPMTGVVLGQRGHNLVEAGLSAARQLVDKVAPTVGSA
jgi:D-alanyl-D-alanine carboxypeptidase (penicillin-binding protein 5/6)